MTDTYVLVLGILKLGGGVPGSTYVLGCGLGCRRLAAAAAAAGSRDPAIVVGRSDLALCCSCQGDYVSVTETVNGDATKCNNPVRLWRITGIQLEKPVWVTRV